MNRSVGNHKAALVLLELELSLIDPHIKEEQLLIGSCHTELICRDGLSGSRHRLENRIVDTK